MKRPGRVSAPVIIFICFSFAVRLGAQVTIPIVHTWGELRKAPQLTADLSSSTGPSATTPRHVTFQVGLESREATSYGGVVLYYLGPSDPGSNYTPEERGLYSIEIEGELPAAHYKIQRGSNSSVGSTTFYGETLIFAAAGDIVIKLIRTESSNAKSKTSRILAQAKVHVVERPEARWYPFWDTDQTGGTDHVADRISTVSVSTPEGEAAVAATPSPRSFDKIPASDQPLPHLMSPSTSVTPQLKMVNGTLIVNLDQDMEDFFPQDDFLTRWWINGKTVEFEPAVARQEMRESTSQARLVREIHFSLKLNEKFLKATKGDRIGVQLLHCPHGFRAVEFPIQMQAQGQDVETEPPAFFSEMTNRVNFIYSGDPQHPQR